VKLPFVPGPSELRAAAAGVRDGVGEVVGGAMDFVPRLGHVVGRVEALLDRTAAIVGRAEEAVTGLDRTRRRADAAVGRAEETLHRADDAITAVATTTTRADGTLGRAEGLVDRLEQMVGGYEGPLAAMAPSLRRLAETLEPDEVEAVVRLIDQLPILVVRLEEVVLPVLASMDNVGEDVHGLLDTMQDLRQVVKGFPGSRLLRRRGADEIAQDEAEETAAT
jgi:ABC-type transporter Mla subunit MlaD